MGPALDVLESRCAHGRGRAPHAGSGSGNAQIRKSGGRGRLAICRLCGVADRGAGRAGRYYKVLRNGDEVFPAMLDAIRRARPRISFESFIYEDGDVGDQFTSEFAAAAARGVRSASCSTPSAARYPDESQGRLATRPASSWLVQPISAVDAGGGQLPHPPQGARRGRPPASPAASVLPITGWATPKWEHWRDTQFRSPGPRSVRSRRRSTRTGSSPAAVRAGARSGASSQRTGAASVVHLEQSHRRREPRQAALPSSHRRRAQEHRHPVAVLHPRRIHALVARRGAQARRAHPRSSPKATSPTQAGEGRQPLRLSGTARQRATRSTNTSRR